MADSTNIYSLVTLVFGMTAALRKEWPTIDGRLVYLVALLFGFVAAFLSYAGPLDMTVAGLRPVAWLGFQVGVGAVGLAAGIGYAADKFTSSSSSAPPATAPVSIVAKGASISTGLLTFCLALVLVGCSGAQQAEERTLLAKGAPIAIKIAEDQILCAFRAYEVGIKDPKAVLPICAPEAVADAMKAIAAAAAKPDGGAGGAAK